MVLRFGWSCSDGRAYLVEVVRRGTPFAAKHGGEIRQSPDILNLLTHITAEDGTRYPIRHNLQLVQTIRGIRTSPKFVHFLDGLRADPELRQLLWLHKSHFSPIKGIELSLLYHEDQPHASKNPLEVEEAHAKAALQVQVWDALERFLPTLMSTFQDLNAKLEEEYEKEKSSHPALSEEDLRERAASKYFVERFLPIGEEQRLNKWIGIGVHRAGDLVLPGGLNMLSIAKLQILDAGRRHLEALMKASRIKGEAFASCITRLAKAYDVLRPALSVVWCSSCLREPQSFVAVGPRDPPAAICPVCSRAMATGTFFHLDSPIAAALALPDGLINLTALWSLASGGAQWAPGVYLDGISDDREKDAVFRTEEMEGYGVLEVKAHYLDTPERTMADHLRSDLFQLLEHHNSYRRAKIPVEELWLVTNLPKNLVQPEVETALKESKFAAIRELVDVCSPEDYDEFDKSFHDTGD